MKTKPKISVITIVYNSVDHLEKTIKSVIAQDCPDMEYIIIDGGSNDGTIEVIKKYVDHIHYWVSEADRGISDAFNKGIEVANGELIGILNASDYYLNDCLNTVVRLDNGADIIYGNMMTIVNGNDDGTYLPTHHKLKKDMSLCHPSVFIRKAAYERYGNYKVNYQLAMDYELLLRFSIQGSTFQYINQTLTAMTMDGVSNEHWKSAYSEVISAQELHLGRSVKRAISNQVILQKKSIAKFLSKTPLSSFVNSYRSRFSKVKKHKND